MNAESLCVPRDQPEKEREGGREGGRGGERGGGGGEKERKKETWGDQALVGESHNFIFQGNFYTLTLYRGK